jgi:protein-L-isoaspartate(D-aspartate) O-methyltransferase
MHPTHEHAASHRRTAANPSGFRESPPEMSAWQRFLVESALAAILASLALRMSGEGRDEPRGGSGKGNDFARLRRRMVQSQLAARDIVDERVLRAMNEVPRHEFVPPERIAQSYEDRALPIGNGQTISQPYIVALMTQLAEPRPGDRALDVGTGCGYQAAVLSRLVNVVHSIEIVAELGDDARERLARLGCDNVHVHLADGSHGWAESAPYDIILLAAAPFEVPSALCDQLAPGGRLVAPVGPEGGAQSLVRIVRQPDGQLMRETIATVSFVPMTGAAQTQASRDGKPA